MVVTKYDNGNTTIILSPNCSATWRQTKWVIVLMVIVVMFIAIAWSFVGAWIVLPFAGFEVGLFAFLMYRVSVYTHTKQVIHIGPINIDVKLGYLKKQVRTQLPRAQVDVFYWETENNWELPRVALCSAEQKLEVGSFLNLDDRKLLRDALQSAGFMICHNKWWKT